MKNSRRCSKCGGSDIVRIPDRRGRCASGNNIYTSNFENFGKIPVIRYVCCSCGYVENWVEDPASPAGHPHALRLTCKWKTAPAARPLNGLQGAVLFFLYGSAAALCAGRAALSAGLPVICARAVLSQEVLCPAHIGAQEPRPGRSEPSEAPFSPLPPAPRHDIQPEPRLCPMRKAHGCGR